MIVRFLQQVQSSLEQIKFEDIENMIEMLRYYREGRMFFVGSGGGTGHASHAACDFRKLCEIESYAVYDNATESTARINDNGWDNSAADYLKASRFSKEDCLFVFSVGGGDEKNGKMVSGNLVNAIKYADRQLGGVVGIVGNRESYLVEHADAFLVIKTEDFKTPVVEGLQSVLIHLIVTALQKNEPVWK